MSMPSASTMHKAIAERDSAYNGVFFYGVISTGIFCFPSCSSKAAKAENIRFFATIQQAMEAGFRPCKRCHSAGKETGVEKQIEIARYIEQYADEKLSLAHLGDIAHLSPSRLQKAFKAVFGISPKTFQDAVRMRHFKGCLKQGDAVIDAIYASGFGSISRVYGEATRNIGMSPKVYRAGAEGQDIYYACRATELGLMMMAATDKGVCSVQFGDDQDVLFTQLQQEFPKANMQLSSALNTPELDLWMQALDQHINQGAPRPDLPLDLKGTAFQIKVWQFLLSIKEGDVVSYTDVAEKIDKPKAVRAVGSACGKNRIAILIPCHRVLRSDGNLGGYRWGLERKVALLEKEKQFR